MKKIKNFIYDTVIGKMTEDSDFKKKFLLCIFIYFASFLAILQADYIFGQDIRLLSNTAGLSVSKNAFVNEVLSLVLFTGTKVQDISPIPQLISIVLLAFSSVALVSIFCAKITFFRVACATVLGLTPYFLPHMCYKFSSLIECLSIFLAIIPFLFQNKKKFAIASILSLVLVGFLYLPAISIYLIVFSFKMIQKKISGQGSVFSIPLISMLFFGGLFYNLKDDFSGSVQKLFDYYVAYWGHNFLGITFSAIILFFIGYIFGSFMKNRHYRQWIDRLILCVGSVVLIVGALFLVGTFNMSDIGFGVGCALSCMLLMMSDIQNAIIKKSVKVIGCLLVWQLVVFGNKFGNLLIAQKQYERVTFEMINEVIMSQKIDNLLIKPKKMQIPLVPFKAQEYPILNDLVFFDLTHPMYFYDYMNFFLDARIRSCSDVSRQGQTSILQQNDFFKFEQINPYCVELEVIK